MRVPRARPPAAPTTLPPGIQRLPARSRPSRQGARPVRAQAPPARADRRPRRAPRTAGPARRPRLNPSRIAAPTPWLTSWRTTTAAPCARASSPVPSSEPSSTTIASKRPSRGILSSTRPILPASLSAGMMTATSGVGAEESVIGQSSYRQPAGMGIPVRCAAARPAPSACRESGAYRYDGRVTPRARCVTNPRSIGGHTDGRTRSRHGDP